MQNILKENCTCISLILNATWKIFEVTYIAAMNKTKTLCKTKNYKGYIHLSEFSIDSKPPKQCKTLSYNHLRNHRLQFQSSRNWHYSLSSTKKNKCRDTSTKRKTMTKKPSYAPFRVLPWYKISTYVWYLQRRRTPQRINRAPRPGPWGPGCEGCNEEWLASYPGRRPARSG